MKFRTFLLIAVPLIIIGLLFAFWPQVKASVNKQPGGSGDGGNGGGSGGGTDYKPVSTKTNSLDLNKVLSNGVRGNEVIELQKMLNTVEKSSPLVVDGIFGAKTAAKLGRLNGGVTAITLNQAYSKITQYTGGSTSGSGSSSASWWEKIFSIGNYA